MTMLTILFVIIGLSAIATVGEISSSPHVVGTAYCPGGNAIPVVVPVNCEETCPMEAY